MNRLSYALLHLLFEFFSSRRDAHVRFLREENRILRARLDQQRLILSPEERSRLLRIGSELNHQVKGIISIVQYRTYARWIKEQQTGKRPVRVGRPRTIGPDIRAAIVRMAKEKPVWGYRRIVGELLKLRCRVCKSSVKRILKEEGIHSQPLSPDRTSRDRRKLFSANIVGQIDCVVAAIGHPFNEDSQRVIASGVCLI